MLGTQNYLDQDALTHAPRKGGRERFLATAKCSQSARLDISSKTRAYLDGGTKTLRASGESSDTPSVSVIALVHTVI